MEKEKKVDLLILQIQNKINQLKKLGYIVDAGIFGLGVFSIDTDELIGRFDTAIYKKK